MVKKISRSFLALLLAALILNLPVTTHQGINSTQRIIKIPLYIKVIEFIDRDYHYGQIVNEITANIEGDEERVIAIFKWVAKNIHGLPQGFDLFDDHTLNIIIRRYGTSDQRADVFTTLCVYAKFSAFFEDEIVRSIPKDRHLTLSYVLIRDRWRIFDVHNDAFFLNERGELASVEDVIASPSTIKVRGRGIDVKVKGVNYEDFFKTLKPIRKDIVAKPHKQVPLLRMRYEVERLFKR